MSRFIAGKGKKKKKRKILWFFIVIFILVMIFNYLDKNLKKVDDKKFVEILLNEANFSQENIFKKFKLDEYDIIYVASSGFAHFWDSNFEKKIIKIEKR